MENQYKFVDFNLYCETCKYKNIKDELGEEPCNSCLAEPVNLNSVKPVKYEANEVKEK